MAGEGALATSGTAATPISQQQPPALQSSPAGGSGLPATSVGVMSTSGSGASQAAATGAQLTVQQFQQYQLQQYNQQQAKAQQAVRGQYPQTSAIQVPGSQQPLPGLPSTQAVGTQLSRSLSGQRLSHLQQAASISAATRAPSGVAGTTHFNPQFLPTTPQAASPGATSSAMLLARTAQAQQQRPTSAAQGSQTRPVNYPQQSPYNVHHISPLQNSVRPGGQGTSLPGTGSQQFALQSLSMQQHAIQARQKQNQGQAQVTHFQQSVSPMQQLSNRSGEALSAQRQQPSQQPQPLVQQRNLPQTQQQTRPTPPQQQVLQASTHSTLTRVPSTGAQMQSLLPGSQQQQPWQTKPTFQQQQQSSQQQQRPQTIPNTQTRPAPLGASHPNNAPTSSAISTDPPDASGHILGKRSIQDLVAQVDPRERLDPEVVDFLGEVVEGFIDEVTSFSCELAKHRKSNILEAKDVLLHLEHKWHITIPGFGGEEYRSYKRPAVSESHKQRLAVVRKSAAAGVPGIDPKAASGATAAPAASISAPNKPGLSTVAAAALASPMASPGLPRIPRV